MATFNGLKGKRYNDMIGLLQQGKPPKEVARWLDVSRDYVEEHVDLAESLAKQEGQGKPGKNETLEALTGEQLATGEGYELKDLRAYCVEFYGCELATNSNRESTVKAFLDAKKG